MKHFVLRKIIGRVVHFLFVVLLTALVSCFKSVTGNDVSSRTLLQPRIADPMLQT
jgi:hypothetical protein